MRDEKSYDAFRDSNHWKVGDTSKQGNSCEYDFSENNIKDTNKMLNRIFSFTGKHVTGNKIGRTLGFPTINIKTDDTKLLPKGVFACMVSDKKNNMYLSSLDILCIVFIILLVINPYYMYMTGFILSFLVSFFFIIFSLTLHI